MKRQLIALLFTGFSLVTVACGESSGTDTGAIIKSAPVGNDLAVTLSNKDGVLKNGNNEFLISFKDSSGKPVEVGAVALNFFMPAMGTMSPMNNNAIFTTTGTAGVYQGKVKLEMAGDWQAQVSYEGAAGKGKTSFTVTVQ